MWDAVREYFTGVDTDKVILYLNRKYSFFETVNVVTKKTNIVSDFPNVKEVMWQIADYSIRNESFSLHPSNSDKSLTDSEKAKMIVYFLDGNNLRNLSTSSRIRAFNTLDAIYESLSKILLKIRDGYSDAKDQTRGVGFEQSLETKMDIFIFIVFYSVFPMDLNNYLFDSLGISDSAKDIFKKCNGYVVKDYKEICNISSKVTSPTVYKVAQKIAPSRKMSKNQTNVIGIEDYIPLNKQIGYMTLLAVLSKLRDTGYTAGKLKRTVTIRKGRHV